MSGVGPSAVEAFLGKQLLPPQDIPATGAVLNDNGQPEWDDSPPEFPSILQQAVYPGNANNVPNRVFHNPSAGGTLERLTEIDAQILELIEERKTLIDKIEEALSASKKMTDTLSYVESDVETEKEVVDNG